MQLIFIGPLLLLVLLGASAKYAYIKEEKTWSEAQQYCQQEYAGLAPISNQQDIVKMMNLAGGHYSLTWTGGEKSDREREQWMFWGGGRVSGFFPAQDESTGMPEESSGSVPDYFHDVFQKRAPFFCYKPVVVREKKSWEQAWSYCRKYHNMLASVASKTEMQLMQRELNKFPTTERVWIGLHFFPTDGWLWVDSQPLEFEIWGSGGKPHCPKVNMECAALKMNRLNISNTVLATITASGIPIINNSHGPGVTSGESGGASGEYGSTSRETRSISADSGRISGESGCSSGESRGNSGVSVGTSGKSVGNSFGSERASGDSGHTLGESRRTTGESRGDSGVSGGTSGDSVGNSAESESTSGEFGHTSGKPRKASGEFRGNSGVSGGTSGESGGNSVRSERTSGESGSNSGLSGATSSESGITSRESGSVSVESGSTSDGSGSTSGFTINLSGDDVWEAHDCEEKLNFICY